MQSNNHAAVQYPETTTEANEFNNIESVESIYSADTIEIIDCVSTHIISSGIDAPKTQEAAANDEFKAGEIYSLDNARMAKQSKSVERRACKSRLTDRRSSARVSANGETQLDRREANRIANVDAIRLAHKIK